MFGISLPELFIIICVILILVRPADLPAIAKYYKIAMKKLRNLKLEAGKLYGSVHDALIGPDEDSKRFILGADGKMHEAFDIDELKRKKQVSVRQQKNKI